MIFIDNNIESYIKKIALTKKNSVEIGLFFACYN